MPNPVAARNFGRVVFSNLDDLNVDEGGSPVTARGRTADAKVNAIGKK
jgi:hypothetical protein